MAVAHVLVLHQDCSLRLSAKCAEVHPVELELVFEIIAELLIVERGRLSSLHRRVLVVSRRLHPVSATLISHSETVLVAFDRDNLISFITIAGSLRE